MQIKWALAFLLPLAFTFTAFLKMTTEYTQKAHDLLLAPGPVEVADNTLFATAQPTLSHTSKTFAEIFSEALHDFKKLVFTEKGTPFVVAGSGTLGWEFVAANLLEKDDNALLLSNGFFGDGFAAAIQVFNGNLDVLRNPEVGNSFSLNEIEAKLKEKKYKVFAITHVDTATGVLAPVKEIAALVHKVSPDTLFIVDAVCALVSEEFRFDDWGVDVVLSAPQKAISAPPGVSLQVLSPRALETVEKRTTPIPVFYASYKKWKPIMDAYLSGNPAYFATPPVNLVYGLARALKNALAFGLENSFAAHKQAYEKVAAAALAAGFKPVPVGKADHANGMSCWYVPEGYTPPQVAGIFKDNGIVVAAGVQAAIKDKYIRLGHMGESIMGKNRGDIDRLVAVINKFQK